MMTLAQSESKSLCRIASDAQAIFCRLPISPPGKFCPSSRCSTPDDMCRAVYFLARPVSGMRTSSRYADNNFAKMRARGHVPVRRLRLIEGEYLINYRLNAARRYGTAHRLEHLH